MRGKNHDWLTTHLNNPNLSFCCLAEQGAIIQLGSAWRDGQRGATDLGHPASLVEIL